MKTRITSKGQITIPVKIRRKLKLQVGQELVFDENAPFIKATKAIDEAGMRSMIGALKDVVTGEVETLLAASRGKVDLP